MGIPNLTQPLRVIIPVDDVFDSGNASGVVTPPDIPDVPSAPSLTVGDGQLTATVSPVSGATTYDFIYNTSDTTAGATEFSGNPVAGTSANITGLTNDTAYYVFVRATNAEGSSAYSDSATATPAAVSGGSYDLTAGVFTLTPPSGVDFGTKPVSAKPWLFWMAKSGVTAPDAVLGRQAEWNGATFRGEFSTAVLGPGSTQSIRYDHSSGGAMLADVVLYDSPDNFFWCRRTYDAFTYAEATTCRVRYYDLTGVALEVGQWLVGRDSGASGKIKRLSTGAVFMEKDVGTIKLPERALVYTSNEIMDIYAEEDTSFVTSLGSAVNDEGYGAYYTFNNKTTRSYPSGATYHNVYFFADEARVAVQLEKGSGQLGDNFSASHYDNNESQTEYAYEWINEIFVVRHGTLNNYDAKVKWRRGPDWILGDVNWRLQTDTYPNKLNKIFQGQVSNGAEPESWRYQDYLLVDDSEYAVIMENDVDFPLCLPCSQWTTGQPIICTDIELMPDWTRIRVWRDGVTLAVYERVV